MADPPLKLLLALAYQGKRFLGNQLQPMSLPTVQGNLLQGLQTIGLTPSNGKFAGRTDAGTHARWQLYQCWIPACRYSMPGLVKRLNALLSPDITVWDAAIVPTVDEFDVRRSVTWRWYRYKAQFSHQPDCWLTPDTAHFNAVLPNNDLLVNCARQTVGKHNFKSFQNTDTPVKQTECHVLAARWQQVPSLTTPYVWQFDIVADRFLYKMVRNLVAEHLMVAQGRQTSELWQFRLHNGLPRQSGQETAPASGLTLMSVYYPPCFQYVGKHTVVLQLEQELNALEFLDENLFCQAAGN